MNVKFFSALAEAGLVQVEPSANKRIYQLRTVPLQELETWLQTYRRTLLKLKLGRITNV
jgi:hypothetical protein